MTYLSTLVRKCSVRGKIGVQNVSMVVLVCISLVSLFILMYLVAVILINIDPYVHTHHDQGNEFTLLMSSYLQCYHSPDPHAFVFSRGILINFIGLIIKFSAPHPPCSPAKGQVIGANIQLTRTRNTHVIYILIAETYHYVIMAT